ncbi:MFS transporter [Micrococcoides hystricis]|uniref:MFS transporter n=1 Tax=Micrococcoides hystricis TaxID=1572761 RepID=A0ABV6PCQ4_9MICC
MTTTVHAMPDAQRRKEERRVLAGTMIGTTIEWYDFFIYAQAAGLVLGPLFFAPVAEANPGMELVISFATIGVSFLFRPLGAIIVGRLGDKVGRKRMLVWTLILMGVATALIGLLPTYEQAGVIAVILLVLLRIAQGFSAGGEWGGAVLMSVEHAPDHKRGHFGAFPQIGVPAGMILASAVLWFVRTSMSQEDFMDYGWRIPFLLSIVLIVVGIFIRRATEESPVFVEMQERAKEASAPLGQLFRNHWRDIIKAALTFSGNNAAGYLVIAFFSSYAVNSLSMDPAGVVLSLTIAAFGWLLFTMIGGSFSDKIGRVRMHQIGYILLAAAIIPVFLLIDHAGAIGSILLFGAALWIMMPGQGLCYGPTSAMYAEMFPANIRYSGVAISYAIGSIVGGAFAPMIAQALLNATKTTMSIGIYIIVISLVSFIAVSLIKETKNNDLGV